MNPLVLLPIKDAKLEYNNRHADQGAGGPDNDDDDNDEIDEEEEEGEDDEEDHEDNDGHNDEMHEDDLPQSTAAAATVATASPSLNFNRNIFQRINPTLAIAQASPGAVSIDQKK